MSGEAEGKLPKPPRPQAGGCESCQFFDYDEDWDDYVCTQDMDEDERAAVLQSGAARCPAYRFYDEYTMVRKQN